MRQDTKRHFHFGVNFILAPAAAGTQLELLQFQQLLADPVTGVTFDLTQKQGDSTAFVRLSTPLEVRIGMLAPQVGQLVVTAGNPSRQIDEFIDDAEAVVDAYQKVWPRPLQILRRDCTIRHLYAVSEAHAFQYLWERRLKQQETNLSALGRGVIGGGLRLVLPGDPTNPEDPSFDIKIESLLEDSTQLFVEAQAVWQQPPPHPRIDPRGLLMTVETFLNERVAAFIAAV